MLTDDVLDAFPTELDSWIDKEYLNQIADDLVNLNDYIPLTIVLLLPDSGARNRFVTANMDLRDSEDFLDKQIQDRSVIRKDYVSGYDTFFSNHPEFSKLIKDKFAYEKWKVTDVDFFDDGPFEQRTEYVIEDYFEIDKITEYREIIHNCIQEDIVPKYPEIESCTMKVYPNHMDWDVDLIFIYDNTNLKNFKTIDVLEHEIRDSLRRYCDEIGASEYYLFISLTLIRRGIRMSC